MSSLKKLAGQTAIYGASSIVGRLLNYLLVPLYTNIFLPAEYGVVTELYAYVGFFVVVLTYGMETAFFRFTQQAGTKKHVYSTILWSLVISSVTFITITFACTDSIASLLDYESHPEYIQWFAVILALDALVSIPFAKLRSDDKAIKFAVLKFINIGLNIGLNLFFLVLCPILYKSDPTGFIQYIYAPQVGVGYIFLSNLAASAITFLLLISELKYLKLGWDAALWRRMFRYAAPLAVVGFAGIINEMLDRVLLKQLLPYDMPQKMAMIGIYGAVYKLSILMALFNQAFRYAAEPFFFSQADKKNAKVLYARVLNYFTALGSFIFIFIMLYIDVFKYFIGVKYHEGLFVVPILLLANLFLGIQINLSIWFKLTDKTKIGAMISIVGAFITILLNVIWIPRYGYAGSAWATLICYVSMVVLTYLTGRKFYPVPYNLRKMFVYIGTALLLYFASTMIQASLEISSTYLMYLTNAGLLLIYISVIYFLNRNDINKEPGGKHM